MKLNRPLYAAIKGREIWDDILASGGGRFAEKWIEAVKFERQYGTADGARKLLYKVELFEPYSFKVPCRYEITVEYLACFIRVHELCPFVFIPSLKKLNEFWSMSCIWTPEERRHYVTENHSQSGSNQNAPSNQSAEHARSS